MKKKRITGSNNAVDAISKTPLEKRRENVPRINDFTDLRFLLKDQLGVTGDFSTKFSRQSYSDCTIS